MKGQVTLFVLFHIFFIFFTATATSLSAPWSCDKRHKYFDYGFVFFFTYPSFSFLFYLYFTWLLDICLIFALSVCQSMILCFATCGCCHPCFNPSKSLTFNIYSFYLSKAKLLKMYIRAFVHCFPFCN